LWYDCGGTYGSKQAPLFLWLHNGAATITQTTDPTASNAPTTSTKKDKNEKNGNPCDGDTNNGPSARSSHFSMPIHCGSQ